MRTTEHGLDEIAKVRAILAESGHRLERALGEQRFGAFRESFGEVTGLQRNWRRTSGDRWRRPSHDRSGSHERISGQPTSAAIAPIGGDVHHGE